MGNTNGTSDSYKTAAEACDELIVYANTVVLETEQHYETASRCRENILNHVLDIEYLEEHGYDKWLVRLWSKRESMRAAAEVLGNKLSDYQQRQWIRGWYGREVKA
jgi:hypothetical protein